MQSRCSVPTLAEVEREHILRTLARCGGNRTQTALVLGISLRGLRIKLNEYQRAGFAIAAPLRGRDLPTLPPELCGARTAQTADARAAR